MSETNSKYPRSNLDLIQETIEPVYRYHLARCEDYLEAQNLTVQSLSSALKWLNAGRATPENLLLWIMEIACEQQSDGRRHGTLHPRKLASTSPSQPISDSAIQDSPFPDQEEILVRNQMAHLSSAWKKLPAKQADALALHYFGGLTPAEISKILHKNETAVENFISREIAFKNELVELADSIHPDKDLLARIQDEPVKQETHVQSWLPAWQKLKTWRPAHPAWRRVFMKGTRLAQFGLLSGVLILGFFLIQSQSAGPATATPTADGNSVIMVTATPEQPSPVPTQGVNPGDRANVVSPADPLIPLVVDNPGNLVPPTNSVCEEWQASVSRLVGQQLYLSNAAFSDPPADSSNVPEFNDNKGTGCLLETPIINWDQHNALSTMDAITNLLISKDFSQNVDISSSGSEKSGYFDQGCHGLAKTFESSDERAILTASWCRPDQNTASSVTSHSSNTSANINLDLGGGFSSSVAGPYNLKLIFTSNELDKVLSTFFSLWMAGDQDVTSYLDPGLLNRLPTLFALDNLVGINPQSHPKVQFAWIVVDNTGTGVRLVVVANQFLPKGSDTSPVESRFQVALIEDNGDWTVREIGKVVPFGP